MKDVNTSEINILISNDFQIKQAPPELSEEEFVLYLADYVEYLIEKRMEYLLSMLYRLDVAERKVNAALLPTAQLPPHVGIAQLIVDRQKRRIWTKKNIKSKELESWDDDIF